MPWTSCIGTASRPSEWAGTRRVTLASRVEGLIGRFLRGSGAGGSDAGQAWIRSGSGPTASRLAGVEGRPVGAVLARDAAERVAGLDHDAGPRGEPLRRSTRSGTSSPSTRRSSGTAPGGSARAGATRPPAAPAPQAPATSRRTTRGARRPARRVRPVTDASSATAEPVRASQPQLTQQQPGQGRGKRGLDARVGWTQQGTGQCPGGPGAAHQSEQHERGAAARDGVLHLNPRISLFDAV